VSAIEIASQRASSLPPFSCLLFPSACTLVPSFFVAYCLGGCWLGT